jgi:hypothetical protein
MCGPLARVREIFSVSNRSRKQNKEKKKAQSGPDGTVAACPVISLARRDT